MWNGSETLPNRRNPVCGEYAAVFPICKQIGEIAEVMVPAGTLTFKVEKISL